MTALVQMGRFSGRLLCSRKLYPAGCLMQRRQRPYEREHSAALIDAIDLPPAKHQEPRVDAQVLNRANAIGINLRISAQIDQPAVHFRLPTLSSRQGIQRRECNLGKHFTYLCTDFSTLPYLRFCSITEPRAAIRGRRGAVRRRGLAIHAYRTLLQSRERAHHSATQANPAIRFASLH